MLELLTRAALGLLNGSTETSLPTDSQAGQLVTDGKRALWTRDYKSQPAQGWKLITKSDSGDISGLYRALRFDVSGAVKVNVLDPDGTTVNTYTRNVQAGEVWPAACVLRVWNTGTDSAVVVDGWS